MANVWRIVVILLLLLGPLNAWATPIKAQDQPNQEEDYTAQARALMEQMSVAERVGQLFLVTFEGAETGRNEAITDLILEHKVGGVVLEAKNDNFSAQGDGLPPQVADLSNQLQSLAILGDAALITETVSGDSITSTLEPAQAGSQVPLFIATQQEGDGAPYSQLRSGVTELPSAAAIGATWDPEHAENVGQILGRELAAMGINMLLGPSLDVLENPTPTSESDIGMRSFGSDPYWVGLMGQAYTSGVHGGSNGRVAVVAKHFPGRGSSDRPLDEEVSTVRKSLEQLKQVELAPFFSVTDQSPGTPAATDALLVTHIRYQGFQGNLRDTTAPVSLDPPALQTLMSLPEFSNWRQEGGLMVSDALGVRAVQRFYDNSGQEFPHRLVAKDALLAGNDLLYVDQFALQPASFEVQLTNLMDTITWFEERYLSDPAFQQRIDDAVLRILTLKLRTYNGDFSLDNVLVNTEELSGSLRQRQEDVLALAQSAITLIAPSAEEVQERLPRPPGSEDQIVVFTDVRQEQQCSDCDPEPYMSAAAIEERILTLYGPQGSAQIRPEQIISFTYGDLKEFLATGPGPVPPPTPVPTPPGGGEGDEGSTEDPSVTPTAAFSPAFQVQSALQNAEWVIFAALDVNASYPSSDALRQFLAERPDIVRNTRTIVFAFNAPYYLDTTEISKLTAFYGVYSKIGAFIDTAVRTLFQEIPARGASPVDIESIDYDLFEATKPDPDQVIDLSIVRDGSPESPASEEPLELVVGDTLRLRTGVIRDHNGNPVPDGTPVEFIQQDRLQGFVSVIGERPTVNGVAELDYVLEARTGQFRITAAAGEATNSQQLDVAIGDNVRVVLITLTPAPTSLPTATPRPTMTPTPSTTPTATATATATAIPLPPEPRVEILLDDALMLLGVLAGLIFTSALGLVLVRSTGAGRRYRTRLIHTSAWGIVGGLVTYNYFALGLPGSQWMAALGNWVAVVVTVAGGLLGLIVGWWQMPDDERAGREDPTERRAAAD